MSEERTDGLLSHTETLREGRYAQGRLPHILIIEDEDDLRGVLRLQLSEMPAQIQVASEGQEGLRLALAQRWDVIVLDVQLPNIAGLEICRLLRARSVFTPIIMLTARASEIERVVGLELGADDYMTKPFSMLELQSRIKAQMRRVSVFREADRRSGDARSAPCRELKFGRLRLDLISHSVELDGRPLAVTPKEWDLLLFFAEHPNQAFSRLQLLEKVWGESYGGYEHTLNSHINRLRAKLGDANQVGCFIRTVWGLGYSFEELVIS